MEVDSPCWQHLQSSLASCSRLRQSAACPCWSADARTTQSFHCLLQLPPVTRVYITLAFLTTAGCALEVRGCSALTCICHFITPGPLY